jgi:hypothetical protein
MSLKDIIQKLKSYFIYDNRFDLEEIAQLKEKGIFPRIANGYRKKDITFTLNNIIRLFEIGCYPKQANTYDERFGAICISYLFESGISAEQADRYSRFDGEGIACLIKANISPEKAGRYPEGFDGKDVAVLIEAGISPEKAEELQLKYPEFKGKTIVGIARAGLSQEQAANYGKRFTKLGLEWIIEADCPPEVANGYDERFNVYNIVKLFHCDYLPEKANAFDDRFEGPLITSMAQLGISPEKANGFSRRFSGMDIAHIAQKDCTPECAERYNKRFNGDDIVWLIEADVSPEKADKYDKRFSGEDIGWLVKADCSPEKADEFDKRLGGSDIYYLIKEEFSAEHTIGYNDKFSREDILNLILLGCTPEQADEYDERFHKDRLSSGWSLGHSPIVDLIALGYSPEKARKYGERFSGVDIVKLIEFGIPQRKANSYHRLFSGDDVLELIQKRVSKKESDKYLIWYVRRGMRIEDFDLRSDKPSRLINVSNVTQHIFAEWYVNKLITDLHKKGVTPEYLMSYDKGFEMITVLNFITWQIAPKTANAYGPEYGFPAIFVFNTLKIKREYLERDKKLEEVYTKVLDCFFWSLGDLYFSSFVTTGKYGIIIRNETHKQAWKFSEDVSKEREFLFRLRSQNKDIVNVARIEEDPGETYLIRIEQNPFVGEIKHEGPLPYLKLEYIEGNSLEHILKQQGKLPEDKVLRYSMGILNGLIELRQAGIWHHRDIRPANIMIDYEKDRAVIIDLGMATTDKKENPEEYQWYNRRYGGPNDLVSLGQVIYYMATGKHIFAKSKSMTRTFSDISDEINDYRTKVYADESGELLKKHLKQVDDNIEDGRIRELIKACLTAKSYHYKKMHRMFQRYVEWR